MAVKLWIFLLWWHKLKILRKCLLVFLCLIIQPWFLTIEAFSSEQLLSAGAAQTAEILGIRKDVEEVVALRRMQVLSSTQRQQLTLKRAFVLRRIFEAVLQVNAAKSQLELELEYAYNILSREQRKSNTINQLFNIVNFAQLSTFYGFFEPYSRLHEQFKQSAIGTCVGSGLAIGLPVLNMLYGKYSRGSNLTPPQFLSTVIDGKPVDGSNLPPLVMKFLDSPVIGTGNNQSRREILSSVWKERYHVDMSKRETLAGIDDNKRRKPFILNTRIILLWSLSTTIDVFNKDLLCLLNEARTSQHSSITTSSSRISPTLGLDGGASEAARLLQLEPVLAELKLLQASSDNSERKKELQITLLETLLSGFLDMHVAANKCQEEINYQYDVVLSQMYARRGRFLQKTYEANFIQTGTIGACAGWSYLKGYSKAGNELFIIADAIGLGLTTVSLMGTHGGWRRNQSPPNSLADFFNLRSADEQEFSPLVQSYLNSASPKRSDGKTRREYLLDVWNQRHIAYVNLKSPRNLEKLASMPSCKWDTIGLVNNRIALLTSLREQFWQFDEDVLDLLRKSWTDPAVKPSSSGARLALNPSAEGAAELLGVQGLMSAANSGEIDENSKLLITKTVLEGFLDAQVDANIIGHEILLESQILDRMNRQKNLAVQLANISNFYQLGILGIISDSMGLSSKSNYVLYADRINIVSGYLIANLAMASLLASHGGVRLGRAQPNVLKAAFGKESENVKLSPLMLRYLNKVSPQSKTNLTRRQELNKYWQESKVLNVNVKRDSMIEKLSAEGKSHHWWSETIKLIGNRVIMLYDLRAVLRSSSKGFDNLMNSLD